MSRFVDQHLSEVVQNIPENLLKLNVQILHSTPHHHVLHLTFNQHHTQATFTPMAASTRRVSAITNHVKGRRSNRLHTRTSSSVVEAVQTEVKQANGAVLHTDTESDVHKAPAKQFQWLKQVREH